MKRCLLIAAAVLMPLVAIDAQTPSLDADPSFARNLWRIGAPMPTARDGAFAGAIGTKIYVVGGANSSTVLDVNEIYDTVTNTWTTGAPMPTARWIGASAVVNNILYAMGGEVGYTLVKVVEAYDPATDTWTTKAPLPITINSFYAVVDDGLVFAIGGYNVADGRLTAAQIYDTATDYWREGAPLKVGKSLAAVGLLGSEIIAAGGLPDSGIATADNEGDRAGSQFWRTLAPMPTARQGGCFEAAEWGTLYFAGGNGSTDGPPLNVLEAYTLKTNSWATGLASMPNAVVASASANVAGRLYCFGGSDNANPYQANIFNYVQIYKP